MALNALSSRAQPQAGRTVRGKPDTGGGAVAEDVLENVFGYGLLAMMYEFAQMREMLSTGVSPTDLMTDSKVLLDQARKAAGLAPTEVTRRLADTIALRLEGVAIEIRQTNESFGDVFGSLFPPHAPDLDDIGAYPTGVAGKLCWDASNPLAGYDNHPDFNIDTLISVSGDERGIFNETGSDLSGTLNDDVAATDNYPAKAFGHADEGTLQLIRLSSTGSEDILHTVDLSSFSSGLTETGFGSGFTLSAAAPVTYAGGDPFPARQYRTGTWHVNRNDIQNGFSRILVRHAQGDGTVVNTDSFKVILDADTTQAVISNESVDTLTQPNTKNLSGVVYNIAPVTAVYHVDLANCYRRTYVAGSAFTTSRSNCSISTVDDYPASGGDSLKALTNLMETLTVNVTRLLDGSFGINSITPQRTVQTENSGGGASLSGLLYDNQSDNDTDLDHQFNGESHRMKNAGDFNTDRSADWDSSESLVGADAGHNNGLEYRNGVLDYPFQNYSAIANAPGGNPNYSAASGERYCILLVENSGGGQNFGLRIEGSATLVQDTGTLTPNSDEVAISCRWPTQTGWMDVTQNYLTSQWGSTADAWNAAPSVGCYAATYGSDQTIPTTSPRLGITIGTKDAANSFDKFYLRIRVPSGWTGNLSRIRIDWGL